MNEPRESGVAACEVRELVGLRCWAVGFPNNEVLQLEIGGAEPVVGSVRFASVGTHGLILRGADWEIRDDAGASLATRESDTRTVRTSLEHLVGEIVAVKTDPSSAALELQFRSGVELVAYPAADGRPEPLWEIFLPDHRMVVGRPDGLHRARSDQSS